MKYKNNFDSYQELFRLTVNRLFVLQKLELEDLANFMHNTMVDKNEIFKKIQEIQIVNLVITKKINSSNFKKLGI